MPFRTFTHDGFLVAVPVTGVRYAEQDPYSPTHSILTVDYGGGCVSRISVDEDFFTVISRLNTIAD